MKETEELAKLATKQSAELTKLLTKQRDERLKKMLSLPSFAEFARNQLGASR